MSGGITSGTALGGLAGLGANLAPSDDRDDRAMIALRRSHCGAPVRYRLTRAGPGHAAGSARTYFAGHSVETGID